ncbi:MAG: acyltransferase, partial [Verrucomicrobiota bacterium]|nr:acyltransferase [Verrucomicrobiota bacterium]
ATTNGRHTLGLLAVSLFFVLSGFLICRSVSYAPSIGRFFWHRFLRIYPGYWVSLIVCACAFAPLFALQEHRALAALFTSLDSAQAFIFGNAALFHIHEFSLEGLVRTDPQSIAGLLSRNPHRFVINGSLWTLPFELGCYIAVAVLAAIGVLRRMRIVMLLLFASLWVLYAWWYLEAQSFLTFFQSRALPSALMLSLFFAGGGACFVYRKEIPSSGFICLALAALTSASVPLGLFGLIAPVALPYAFLWLAFRLPLARFEARGDFSYGTYIYAFPVQQGFALLGLHYAGLFTYFTCSLLVTLLFAIASYHLVEAPCLRFKHVKLPAALRRKQLASQLPVISSCATGTEAELVG